MREAFVIPTVPSEADAPICFQDLSNLTSMCIQLTLFSYVSHSSSSSRVGLV